MNQDIPTESDLLDQLGSGLNLPPVTLTLDEISARSGDATYDALLVAAWDDDEATFAVEYKRLGTPKEFASVILQIQSWSLPNGTYPLLLLPYLKPEQLDELDGLGISGVDLCGNGVITVPGRLKVYRTGHPNRFKSTARIKNVYRGKTSLVARVFAEKKYFPTVQSLRDEIVERDVLAASGLTKPIGLSTVSKALKTLEQDLIVARDDDGAIRLLQRDQLLDRILRNDEPLEETERVQLKADVADDGLVDWIAKKLVATDFTIAATGLSSTERYAVMQRGPVIQLFTPDVPSAVEALISNGEAKETDRFENIVLIKSKRPIDYFASRTNDSFPWASPLQTWLELMRGDKRDRETAEQVHEILLKLNGDE